MARNRQSTYFVKQYIERLLGKGIYPSGLSCYEDTISFKIKGAGLTFKNLEKLSKGLRTKLIDIEPGYSGPGCDSCGYGEETWVGITIRGAKVTNKAEAA